MSQSGPPLSVRIRRRLPGIASVLVIVFALLLLFGPVLMLALFSFNDSSIISLPWEGFTTRWYEKAFDSVEAKDAILNSLAGGLVRDGLLARARHPCRLGSDPSALRRARRARRASTGRCSWSPG